ncbi:SET domain-containing protein [Polyplosphaeria fusca]|uniref:SET domain-containing protein n=1 Tax=Polyplosphaeria fusca TaxID=682080 RepID=A0A9P4QLC6_9PLEO|nr:SET domain-containing protein [Polyplosphaeria fusca]
MYRFASLSLLTAATALTNDKFQHVQQPLFKDACPSNSIINGECQGLPLPDASNPSFAQNISQAVGEAHDSAHKAADIPWTFWPECYSNEKTTEPYCVFTHQSFAGGRGITIIDTATNAYRMLSKPAFTHPEVLNRVNDFTSPPFSVHEFPIKGRGLVANKTLHRGTQIFASTPLVLANPSSYDLSASERLALQHRGIATLPPASQSLFWTLLDHFKGDAVEDRINTNAFEVYISSSMTHAVLPEIAMLNHDCRPNAAYFFDEETLSHHVHATQTIFPGEEITITYINNERSRDRRVKNLKQNWGFECSCSSCSAHPDLVAESDARLAQMEVLAEKLGDWSEESTATPGMAETLVSLYEQERLFASLGAPYKLAAEAYAAVGDRWNAVKYARLGAELEVLDKGFRDQGVGQMRGMAEKVEMSWSWKKRVSVGRGGCGHGH